MRAWLLALVCLLALSLPLAFAQSGADGSTGVSVIGGSDGNVTVNNPGSDVNVGTGGVNPDVDLDITQPDTPADIDLPSVNGTITLPGNLTDALNPDTPEGWQAGQVGLPVDSYCGNYDSCVSGSSCYANRCRPWNDDQVPIPAGTLNRCTATDCCRSGLTCSEALKGRCGPNIPFDPSVTCTGTVPPKEETKLNDDGSLVDPNSAAGLRSSISMLALLAVSAVAVVAL